MILPDRSAIVTEIKLYKYDIVRIFNTIQFEFDQESGIDCTIQCTYPDGRYMAAALGAFFENPNMPHELNSVEILVQTDTPERKSVWLFASRNGVFVNVEGGGESWNKGFFERLIEAVKSSQKPPAVKNKPKWYLQVFGLLLLVDLLSTAFGIDALIKTGNPVVLIIGIGGVIIIGYLNYLSYQWYKESVVCQMGRRFSTISLGSRPGSVPRPNRSSVLNPTHDIGLMIVGAIASCIAAVVTVYSTFFTHF